MISATVQNTPSEKWEPFKDVTPYNLYIDEYGNIYIASMSCVICLTDTGKSFSIPKSENNVCVKKLPSGCSVTLQQK